MAKKRKFRVGFSTIFYPVAMGRYFLEALLRRGDTEVFSAGPFTGAWIPWKGGMYLPQKYVRRPDLPFVFSQGSVPTMDYGMVGEESKKFDLWIEANAGLKTLGRPSCKYALIKTDPHVLQYDTSKVDISFSMQKPYMAPDDIWLPYAYDPVWHTPTAIRHEAREWDAAMIGLQYPVRLDLANRLRGLGLKVNVETGPAYDDYQAIYHNTKVGINWSSLQDTTARVFEVMAFGIAPVFNRVPDLQEMFKEGEHYYGFQDAAEATMAVLKLAQDPVMAEELGRSARRAVEPHTYDARIQKVYEVAGLV